MGTGSTVGHLLPKPAKIKAPRCQAPHTTPCPLPSLVISNTPQPHSSLPPRHSALLRSGALVFGVFLSCRKFLMLSIMQHPPPCRGSPPRASHVLDSQHRRRLRSPPRSAAMLPVLL